MYQMQTATAAMRERKVKTRYKDICASLMQSWDISRLQDNIMAKIQLIQILCITQIIISMVLTQNQRSQLNKDILEYLLKSQYTRSAEIFSEEIGVQLAEVDPQGNKLQIKWKSILSLQKKINNLEDEVKNLKEQVEKGGKKSNGATGPVEDIYIPKTPAKFALAGHKSNITSLSFHPQYTQIATSSDDGTIKIWEFETGDFERTLKGHTNPVTCVNYDQSGKYLASSSSDLTIKLWDLSNDFTCCKTFFGHNHNVSYVAFCKDGDNIISCSRDKTIKLWEISTGYCKRTFTGHEGWVRTLALSDDGQTFVSASDDMSVIIWNISKEGPVNRFFAHQNVIESVLLIEGENSAKLMNAEFLKNKFTPQAKVNALKQLNEQGSNGMASYLQTFLFTAGRDKLIKLFILQTGEHLQTFFGHDNWVRSLSLHSSGKYLYSASDDKTVRIWDLQFGKEKKKIEAHEHFISTVRFNGKYGVIGSGGNDLLLKIWQLK